MSREEIARPDELRKKDAQARTLAQREFERPVVVEAGAGTGKTTALVARVLAWSFGPGWNRAKALAASTTEVARDDRIAARVLQGVVAITFTEKAAAEMSERIGLALLEVERGESPGWLQNPQPTLGAEELCERCRIHAGHRNERTHTEDNKRTHKKQDPRLQLGQFACGFRHISRILLGRFCHFCS